MDTEKAGAEGFIWLVVGLFWIISQIAGASSKKKRPQTLEEGEEETAPAMDPISELMRKLSGAQDFKIPTPPEPVDLPEAIHPDIMEKESVEPLQQQQPPAAVSAPIAQIDIRPSMLSFRNTLPALKLPPMSLNVQPSKQSGKQDSAPADVIDPADRQSVRRAMLSHIIFSPPKALEKMQRG